MTRTLIRGGIVIDPIAGTERRGDVLIDGGTVEAIEEGIDGEGAVVLALRTAPGE